MRVAVATVRSPFIAGGAERHAAGLVAALRRAGHEADVVETPFSHAPAERVERSLAIWREEDLERLNGVHVDRVICLKFPAYHCRHPRKALWLLHQHRAVFDRWDDAAATPADRRLRALVAEADRELARVTVRYANSATVAARLRRFSGVEAQPLHHPPPDAELFYAGDAEPFIFAPSRFEALKRQSLLIEAMALVRAPVAALLAGSGPMADDCARLAARLGVADRVRLLGEVDEDVKRACYAACLGVFFGPLDEDLGYVTLEAMLSEKPVVTCADSGGPLEFVEHEATGLVAEPSPEAVAAAIDRLANDRAAAREMGRAGAAAYRARGISWENVVRRLLA
jgi:glycosyltransferase involved in cell wall biosynthesis